MAIKNLSPLGKGLKALLPAADEDRKLSLEGGEQVRTSTPYFSCPIAFIQPNPYQPRKNFAQEELESLAASIREKGVLQPLVIRQIAENRYELIAGERRLRAARMAELERVPVLVKDIAIADRLELALIENIQRENLSPLEEAEAYAKLMDEFGLTQDIVAKRVGKNRSTVANSVRLLQLPEYAQSGLAAGAISAGHARVLLSLADPELMQTLYEEIINKKLSVRETEAAAKNTRPRPAEPKKRPKREPPAIPDSYCKSLANNLVSYLGCKSKIIQNGGRGKIEIEYYSSDDLERVLSLIVKEQ